MSDPMEYTPTLARYRRTIERLLLGQDQNYIDFMLKDFDVVHAEYHRKVSEKAWDEGRASIAEDFLRPVNENGMRPATPNPYRKAVDE